jgi:hypothetical protein
MDDLSVVDEVETGERHHPIAVERGWNANSKPASVLRMGNLAMRSAALTRRFSRKLIMSSSANRSSQGLRLDRIESRLTRVENRLDFGEQQQ